MSPGRPLSRITRWFGILSRIRVASEQVASFTAVLDWGGRRADAAGGRSVLRWHRRNRPQHLHRMTTGLASPWRWGVMSSVGAVVIGAPLNLLASWFVSFADVVVMRAMESVLSIPPLTLAVVRALGDNVFVAIRPSSWCCPALRTYQRRGVA